MAAASEAEAVSAAFRRWGAQVSTPGGDASADDLASALMTSDVVHVAAHATPNGVFVAHRNHVEADVDRAQDPTIRARRTAEARLFGTCDLDALGVGAHSLRCRLLVLSACDLAQLEPGPALSFVYALVQMNVNVIATAWPMNDAVARAFFRNFYRELLPGHQTTGLELAHAVRRAAANCPDAIKRIGCQERWQTDLSGLRLFGDPTLHLKSIRIPRARRGRPKSLAVDKTRADDDRNR